MSGYERPDHIFSSETVRVTTPDGTMFVNIMEDSKGNPVQIQLNVGKAGNSVAAWAFAMATLCTMLLSSGKYSINDLIAHLSGITTNKHLRHMDGVRCSSGPEGLVIALLKYRDGKFADMLPSIEDDSADRYYRPPVLHQEYLSE